MTIAWTILTWAFVGLFAVGVAFSPYGVGEPRRPKTRGDATAVIILGALLIAVLLHSLRVI